MQKFAFFTPVVKSLNKEVARINKTGIQQVYAAVAAGDQINTLQALWDVNKATLKAAGVTNKREYMPELTGLKKSQMYDLLKVFKNRDKVEPYLSGTPDNPSITGFLQYLKGDAPKKDKPKVVTIQNTATGDKVTIPVADLTAKQIEALEALGMIC